MSIERLDGLSFKDLRCIASVARHRHFGRAAQALHMAQPSVSASIAKAESLLQRRLFERSGRSFCITPGGAEVLHVIENILAECSTLTTEPNEHSPLQGAFQLGLIPTVGSYYLAHALPSLLSQFPDLRLVLTEDITPRVVAEVEGGALDACILALPSGRPGLKEVPIFQDELVLAAPDGHRIEQCVPLRVSDLRRDELILMSEGHCLREQTLQLCGNSGREREIAHAASIESLKLMVQARAGCAVVPGIAATALHDGAGFRFHHFAPPAPSRTIGLVFSPDHTRANDARAMAAFLQGLAATPPSSATN
jgi:LysR family transcriptional regulator, hydrogen peroxide-inducible genes activator